jgi:hypothetical protein
MQSSSEENISSIISAFGNVLAELLQNIPDPFIFEGHEETTETEALIKFTNSFNAVDIIVLIENRELKIQKAIISKLKKPDEICLTILNSSQKESFEFIQTILLPTIREE